jgi:hypothetical protein
MAERKKSIELSEPVLVEALNLQRIFQPVNNLETWLSADGELDDYDRKILAEVETKLMENADSWNEEELKMQFISIIMFLVRFNDPIRTYYDREIDADVEGIYIKCKADMLLSKGIGELIRTPYFFLHEYKREKKYSGDPVGQMLAGMLIAQEKNADKATPIYGCYVQGRFWFFSVLEGKKYTISNSFNSTVPQEAQKIIFILRELKAIILKRLEVR